MNPTDTLPAHTVEAFAEKRTTAIVETATEAAAAAAKAQIESRYIMAMRNPRDLDAVRVRLLKECKRPGFAGVAIYDKPIGRDGITGPSIRFAEAAIRCMTNILAETTTLYDDSRRRIVQVSVTDLEANISYPKTVTIEKTVERRNSKGRTVISERVNSYGDTVFIVEATDDEILNKENALISKALRNCALRVIPGDIVDEAIAQLQATRQAEFAQDPDAARKKMIDAFATLGVQPADLKNWLGRDLATASPAELDKLRGIFSAIKEGETSWSAVMENKREGIEPKAPEEPKAKTKAPAPTDELAKEVEELRGLVEGATTDAELSGLATRIASLPEDDRAPLRAAWDAKMKEVAA